MSKSESKISRVIAYIKLHGSARTPEIAEHLGIENKSVLPLLWDHVQRGLLVTCKVERPGQKAINEYRLSAGGKAAPFMIRRAALPPRAPAVTEAAPSVEKAPRKARTAPKVHNETARPQIIPENIPAGTEYVAPSTFRCGLFNSGHLEMVLRDGSRIELPPEDTRELCDYLDRTLVKEAA